MTSVIYIYIIWFSLYVVSIKYSFPLILQKPKLWSEDFLCLKLSQMGFMMQQSSDFYTADNCELTHSCLLLLIWTNKAEFCIFYLFFIVFWYCTICSTSWLLADRSHDLSQAEMKVTTVKPEQNNKKTIISSQNG